MKYTVMQIKSPRPRGCIYSFMHFEYAIDNGFNLNDYEEMYVDDMPLDEDESIEHFLDSIFTIFNIHRPEDFEGHSMSVSDLVKLEDGRVFYCDSCGWVEVQ